MSHSAVLILPAALRDAGNQLAVAMGHDGAQEPNTYNIPLSADGTGEPTHYGTHAWATDAFRVTIEAAKGGNYPPGMEAAAPVVEALIASFRYRKDTDASEHFDSVAASNGLERRQEVDL